MTVEEAIAWCSGRDVKVCFYDREKKHLCAVKVARSGDDTHVLGQGETFVEAVEEAIKIQTCTPERGELGRIAYETYYQASMSRYDDEEVWRRVGDAVASRLLEMQQLALEASE